MLNPEAKYEKIERMTREGYNVNGSAYISEAWEIFKKFPGGFIAFIFVTYAITIVIGLIPFGSFANIAISPCLGIGLVIVVRKIMYGEPYEFGDFFKGFNKITELFVMNLLGAVMLILAFICLIIPGFYLAIAYGFMNYFTYFFFDGSYWNTLERCRKFMSKQWFEFFVFFLLLGLVNLAGLICLGVGLLVSVPVSMIALFVAFERLIGTQEEEVQNDNIMNDLYPNSKQ
ncbi:MAG: hypothetical protein U0V74_17115 [Chitinophagales bacterium]